MPTAICSSAVAVVRCMRYTVCQLTAGTESEFESCERLLSMANCKLATFSAAVTTTYADPPLQPE